MARGDRSERQGRTGDRIPESLPHRCPDATAPAAAQHDTLRLELTITADTYHEFLEWRHKIMTRTAVVAGAGAIAARWLIEHQGPGQIGADDPVRALVPTVVGIVCVVAALLDAVNQRVMNSCYATGVAIEDHLLVGEVGFFHQLDRLFSPGQLTLSYRVVLRAVFLSTAIAMFTTALWILVGLRTSAAALATSSVVVTFATAANMWRHRDNVPRKDPVFPANS